MGTAAKLAWALYLALLATVQLWLVPLTSDWVSAAVDEGYVSYSARRILEGDWPHRDFFFLWTPGTALLHALLQGLGAGWEEERVASLLAFLVTVSGVIHLSRRHGVSRADHPLLAALLAAWSFSLWNFPYASWYAVALVVVAVVLLPGAPAAAALFLGLSFWFKQNVGLLAGAGALAALWLSESPRRAWRRFLPVFLAVVLLPFGALALAGEWRALAAATSQIFLFPLRYPALMGTAPSPAEFAAPLTTFGLWTLSLYFLRSESQGGSARMIQLGVLAYAAMAAARSPRSYLECSLAVLSIGVWPALGAFAASGGALRWRRLSLLLLPLCGAFLQVFPRLDFQHLLFVAPLSLLALCLVFSALGARYPALPALWLRLPLFGLLGGGLLLQGGQLERRWNGARDSLGQVTSGAAFRLNEEVLAVGRQLKRLGLDPGGPLLVVPNATAVYRWLGYRNPTPHQQLFPGYVEAYGEEEGELLRQYREKGGRFVLVQERSGAEKATPRLWAELLEHYEVVEAFPEHFTLYAPREKGDKQSR